MTVAEAKKRKTSGHRHKNSSIPLWTKFMQERKASPRNTNALYPIIWTVLGIILARTNTLQ